MNISRIGPEEPADFGRKQVFAEDAEGGFGALKMSHGWNLLDC